MAEAIGNLRWYFEIDGITQAVFQEVHGLVSETEIIEHRESGPKGNMVIKKIPGRLKVTNLELKRGITDSMALYQWRQKIEQGQVEANRKNGTLTLYNPAGAAVAVFSFVAGWPFLYKGPSLDSTKDEIAIEEIHISHNGLTRTS